MKEWGGEEEEEKILCVRFDFLIIILRLKKKERIKIICTIWLIKIYLWRKFGVFSWIVVALIWFLLIKL